MRRGTEADFWAKVNKKGRIVSKKLGRCWEFTGKQHTDGYAMIRRRPAPPILVHRYSYELLVGPIPKGLTLDHKCRVRHCVNPKHLEPVSHAVNILRGTSFSAVNSRKTHCPKGHKYDVTVKTKTGGTRRYCRACQRQANRECYARKKGVYYF